eukprot:Blabericola_migrator_1__8569@NODE_4482_length_1133_cov_8_722326_g2776_i0_p1_GENE_NODE_4482_length_1133_cov_8_722326_g2776_i0NODE_4482_length_1133_cov_8_722326_g2776_i0_p1_ORF_typecomplete_len134_score10_61NinD/PF17466_2/0_15NinD/PF17466_2/6_7e03_NODE_4482_length_1133_cov_8_722326_g2776_i07221123
MMPIILWVLRCSRSPQSNDALSPARSRFWHHGFETHVQQTFELLETLACQTRRLGDFWYAVFETTLCVRRRERHDQKKGTRPQQGQTDEQMLRMMKSVLYAIVVGVQVLVVCVPPSEIFGFLICNKVAHNITH